MHCSPQVQLVAGPRLLQTQLGHLQKQWQYWWDWEEEVSHDHDHHDYYHRTDNTLELHWS